MRGERSRPLPPEEEQALVARLQQGDTTALEALWRAYAGVIYSAVIYPSLPIPELAEEVLQNTFLKAFERIGGYTWQSRGILPWLKTIARNLAMDVHRKHQRTERFCKGYGQHVEVTEADAGPLRPDKALMRRQEQGRTRAQVAAVLDSGKLNDRYRGAIEMRLYEELDRETCAQRMGVKVGTFDVVFHRALKRFEKVYKDMFGDPSAGGQP